MDLIVSEKDFINVVAKRCQITNVIDTNAYCFIIDHKDEIINSMGEEALTTMLSSFEKPIPSSLLRNKEGILH